MKYRDYATIQQAFMKDYNETETQAETENKFSYFVITEIFKARMNLDFTFSYENYRYFQSLRIHFLDILANWNC